MGSINATYPIGISTKKINHDIVEEKFFTELSNLNNGKNNLMYSQVHERNVRVHPEIFTVLMDQPEKRSANCIMLGNGKFTARWGYAADIAAVLTGIPSCHDCFRKLLMNNVPYPLCKKCVSWNIASKSGLMDFPIPQDYPDDLRTKANGKLSPKRITYLNLKNAKLKCHNKLLTGEWSEKNAKAYLKVEGMNNYIIDNIIGNALNERKFKYVISNYGDNSPEYMFMMKQKEVAPDKYTILKDPAFWKSNLDLHQCIDAVMHLIFLGIVKQTLSEVISWLSLTRKKNFFSKTVASHVNLLIEMKLDWLVILNLDVNKSNVLVGYVSENYLAVGRILNWLFFPLLFSDEKVSRKTELFLDFTYPMKYWVESDLDNWLKMYGMYMISRDISYKRKLIEMLQPYAKTGNIQSMSDYVWKQEGKEKLYMLCSVLSGIISRIMQLTCTKELIEDMNRHVCIYLDTLHNVEKITKKREVLTRN